MFKYIQLGREEGFLNVGKKIPSFPRVLYMSLYEILSVCVAHYTCTHSNEISTCSTVPQESRVSQILEEKGGTELRSRSLDVHTV